MPAIYAHERFGKMVLEKLPRGPKTLAERYRQQYGMGLQGPDFLFFYKAGYKDPVNQMGDQIHRTPAEELFNSFRGTIRKCGGTDSAECALALGTICHFVLDSSCHWYVNQYIKESGVGHVEIETEFERYLLTKDGLDPLRYNPSTLIHADSQMATILSKLYDFSLLDHDTVLQCLKDMYRIKKVLVAPSPVKQAVIRVIFHLTGHYDELQGHLMAIKPNPACDASDRKLEELFDAAIPQAVELITEFYDDLYTDKPLNPIYDKDFE